MLNLARVSLSLRKALFGQHLIGEIGSRYRLLGGGWWTQYEIVPRYLGAGGTRLTTTEADALLVTLSEHRSGSWGRDGIALEFTRRIGVLLEVRFSEADQRYRLANMVPQWDLLLDLEPHEADEFIVLYGSHRRNVNA